MFDVAHNLCKVAAANFDDMSMLLISGRQAFQALGAPRPGRVQLRAKLFDRLKHYYTSIACWAGASRWQTPCATDPTGRLAAMMSNLLTARSPCGARTQFPHPMPPHGLCAQRRSHARQVWR